MKTIKSLPLGVLLISSMLLFSGNSVAEMASAAPGEAAIHAKLKKCEVAFDKAHSGKMSQEEAWIARREHKKLTMELLADLNKRNSAVSLESGEVLSNEQVLTNFKVMGRLLEMLAIDHPTQIDEWGYPLVR